MPGWYIHTETAKQVVDRLRAGEVPPGSGMTADDARDLGELAPPSPVEENGGHECLLARATSIADPAPDDLSASTERHVAQRNLMLAAPTEDMSALLDRLGMVLPAGSDLELLHGGRQLDPILLAHGLREAKNFRAPAMRRRSRRSRVRRARLPRRRAQRPARTGAGARRPGDHRAAGAGPGADGDDRRARPDPIRRRPAPFTAPAPRQKVPEMTRLDGAISPARALIEALGVNDLRAGTIAHAISSRSGDGNLLRFQAVRNGVVQGGCSVIVRTE